MVDKTNLWCALALKETRNQRACSLGMPSQRKMVAVRTPQWGIRRRTLWEAVLAPGTGAAAVKRQRVVVRIWEHDCI